MSKSFDACVLNILLTSFAIFRLACWFYTDGKVLTDLIWAETLKELEFAGAEQIIASVQSSR